MASEGAPATSVTYHAVMQSLASLSERAKKHRKSGGGRALDNVLADAEQLLFSLKHHNMLSDSPSSRVVEAQVYMNKAAIEKIAGHPEDEAAAYLTASGLWMAMESERKAVNMMTSGDALARAVLCCAMACNVLLTVKPNVASSPLPIKLTKMLHHHLARCWSVCMRLAHRLGEFGCFEMSADYFELAAILTTMDGGGVGAGSAPLPPRSTAALSGKRTTGPNPPTTPNGSAATAGGGQQPPSQHCDVESVMSGPFGTPTAASRGPRNSSSSQRGGAPGGYNNGSSTMLSSGYSPTRRLLSSMQQSGGGGSAAAGSPTQSIRSRGGAATTSFSTTYRADRVFSGSVYGAELKRGQAAPALILNGFLDQYITALASCAMTTALIQDYPRCLTLLDDLLAHMVGIERSRRPELRPSWAQRRARPTSGDDDGGDGRMSNSDEGEGVVATTDPPPPVPGATVLSTEVPFDDKHQEHGDGGSMDADVGPPVGDGVDNVVSALHAASIADTTSIAASSDSAAVVVAGDNAARETPPLAPRVAAKGIATTTPATASNASFVGNNTFQGHQINNSSMVSASTAGVTGQDVPAGRAASISSRTPTTMQQTPLPQSAPSSSLGGCPLAPPPGGSLHAHAVFTNMEHFFFLVETESTYIQMRIVKIVVLLILRDPQVSQSGAREEIGALYELGQLYRTHERYTQFRSKQQPSLCASRRLSEAAPDRAKEDATKDEEVPSSPPRTNHVVGATSASSFSAVLFRLCATLEVIVDGSEATSLRRHLLSASGSKGVRQETIVREAFADVNAMCKALGVCSRNLVILLHRAQRSIVGV